MKIERVGKGHQQVSLAGRMLLCVLVLWAVLTVLFYMYGGEKEQDWAGAAYSALQLFFVNVDHDSFKRTDQPFGQLLLVARYIVPWLITLLALLAFVDSLRVWATLKMRRYLVFGGRPLVLIAGLGEKGLAILKAERNRGDGAKIVVIESDPDNPAIPAAKAAGATVWIGDATGRASLDLCCWKRPRRIYAMTGSDQTNLLALQATRELFSQAGQRPRADHLDVYALIQDIRDKRNASSLDVLNHDDDSLWTHLMDYEEDIAAYLLGRNPVLPVNDRGPRVLIVGAGALGEALTLEVLKQGHYMERDGRIPMPSLCVVDLREENLARFAGLQKTLAYADKTGIGFASLETHLADVVGWTFEDYRALRGEKPFTHIFVSLGSELRNLTISDRLANWEREAGMNAGFARVVTFSYEDWGDLPTPSGAAQQSYLVEVFQLREAYAPEAIHWREKMRQRAIGINACHDKISEIVREGSGEASGWVEASEGWYVRQMKSSFPGEGEKNWTKKSQRHRDASIDQAWHMPTKLRELGIDLDSETAPDRFDEIIKNPTTLRGMSETEHRRWNAAKLLDGYVRGDQKNDAALLHPDLKPFAELKAKTQSYDFALMFNLGQIIRRNGLAVTDCEVLR